MHPELDLRVLDIFKVIKDGQLVNEKDKAHALTLNPIDGAENSSKKNEGFLYSGQGGVNEKEGF